MAILDTVRGRRTNGALHDIEETLEDQISTLRDEIAALAKAVRKDGASQSRRLRAQAESSFDDLMGRSEDLLHELQKGYQRGSREVTATVRRHPAAAIGAAAAVGVLIAFMARR